MIYMVILIIIMIIVMEIYLLMLIIFYLFVILIRLFVRIRIMGVWGIIVLGIFLELEIWYVCFIRIFVIGLLIFANEIVYFCNFVI